MRQLNTVAESRRGGHRVFGVLSVLGGMYFTWVLGVVVFGQDRFFAAYQTNTLVSNLLLLPLALLPVLGLWAVKARAPRRHALPLRSNGFLLGYFAALLLIQLLVARSLWFYPGWDVETVYQTALDIVEGGAIDHEYFAAYTNNAALSLLLSIPLWIAGRLGKDVPYTVLVYLSTLMVNAACFICMLCVRKLTKSRAAFLTALALCTCWIALSLTMTIPYTDTYAVLFPILALYVYLSRRLPLFWKWALISLICVFGSTIKPTVLIILLALALVLGIGKAVNARGRAAWKRVLTVAAALIIGATPGLAWKLASVQYLAGEANPQQQHSLTHFLMMGLNGNTYGGYSTGDAEYSASFATLTQRRQANLAVAWERVSGCSLSENLSFFTAKAYKAFGDGSMAQNKSYLVLEMPARTGWWAALLGDIFYADGQYNAVFQTAQQALWLLILLLILAAIFGKSRNKSVTAILAVTLTGLGFYLMLFEVWPRYMYLYSPVFVVLAGMGADTVRQLRYARTAAGDGSPV